MALTFVIVVVTTKEMGGSAASGSLVAALSQTISDGESTYVASGQVIDPLDANGNAAICLASNVGVNPMNTYYSVGLDLGGNTYNPQPVVVPNAGLFPLDTGSGAPGSGVGSNGGWYLDEVAEVVYGPKVAGTWPSVGISVLGIGTTAPSGVMTLAAMPPALLGAPMISYVLTSSIGQAFGVAGPLDGEGQMPAGQLGNISEAGALLKSEDLADVANPALALENLSGASTTALAGEATTRAAADAALTTAVDALQTTAWAPETSYVAGKIVTYNAGLYQAPSGGVPERSTFQSGDWDLLSNLATPFGTTAGTAMQGNDARVADLESAAYQPTSAFDAAGDATEAANAAQTAAETYAATQASAAQTAAESFATAAVGTETARAEGVEVTLANDVTAEATRAEGVEATLGTAITAEQARAEGAESTLTTNLATEATTRASADATLAGAISGETTRAEGAEATNASAISAEVTRAETAEATKASTTALTAETSRAEAAESAAITTAETFTTSAVATETSRAETAEGTNASAIAAEATTRATADGLRVLNRGAWAATTAYAVNDLVTVNGGAYVCATAHTSGGSFVGTDWTVLVPPTGTFAPITIATAGHPTTGTWPAGQSVIDSNGIMWNTAAGGSPGTWVQTLVPTTGGNMSGGLGIGGFTINPRSPFGQNAVIDSSYSNTGYDFIGSQFNAKFTGQGWETTVAPDNGFMIGCSFFTSTGLTAGDGNGIPSFQGMEIGIQIDSATVTPPSGSPYNGKINIATVQDLQLALFLAGTSILGNASTLWISPPAYNNPNTCRACADGVITGGNTLTSATAAFVSGDTGSVVTAAGIPYGTTATYVNATTITLSQTCTNGTGLAFAIGTGGRVEGPVYGVFINAIDGQAVGSTDTFALYSGGGNNFLGGPLTLDLTKMTLSTIGLNPTQMSSRSGVVGANAALNVVIPQNFGGRVIDCWGPVSGNPKFQYFYVTQAGAAAAAQGIVANIGVTGQTEIGGVGTSLASGIAFGTSAGLDSIIQRVSAGVMSHPGPVFMVASTVPSSLSGSGALWVNTADGTLHFLNPSGVDAAVAGGLPTSTYQKITTSGTLTAGAAGVYEIGVTSGGGGGGGGGTGVVNQTGGGGGGAGVTTVGIFTLTAAQVVTFTLGAGGTSGAGGAAASNTGVAGGTGGNSTVTGTGIALNAAGSGGGAPSTASSTAIASGGIPGFGTVTSARLVGVGGLSTSTASGQMRDGTIGGGGGGSASGTGGGNGGTGGGAGTLYGGLTAAGTAGANGSTAGGVGSSAAAGSGCGGGGGGGAGTAGAGGNGGVGGSGFGWIKQIA